MAQNNYNTQGNKMNKEDIFKVAILIVLILAAFFYIGYTAGSESSYDEGVNDGIEAVAIYQASSSNILMKFEVNNQTGYQLIPIRDFCEATLKNKIESLR